MLHLNVDIVVNQVVFHVTVKCNVALYIFANKRILPVDLPNGYSPGRAPTPILGNDPHAALR